MDRRAVGGIDSDTGGAAIFFAAWQRSRAHENRPDGPRRSSAIPGRRSAGGAGAGHTRGRPRGTLCRRIVRGPRSLTGRRLRHLLPAGADPREPRDGGAHDDGDREIHERDVHVSRRPRGHRRHSRAADGPIRTRRTPKRDRGARHLRRVRHRRTRAQVERLRGPRREGQDRAPAGERSAGDEGGAGAVRRPCAHLLRTVDLQVRRGGAAGRRGRDSGAYDGVGLVSLERRPGKLGWDAGTASRRHRRRRSSGCGPG